MNACCPRRPQEHYDSGNGDTPCLQPPEKDNEKPPENNGAHTPLRFVPFCIAKRHESHGETGRFRGRNGPFYNQLKLRQLLDPSQTVREWCPLRA